MKSSIRSKLFLIVYGIILAFIAGLILLNNTFLENYYVRNREASLIEAFEEVKEVDIESSDDYIYTFLMIEAEYNINIHVLEQVGEFEQDYVWDGFSGSPTGIYERRYGERFSIPEGVVTKILYDFNNGVYESGSSYAESVERIKSDDFDAYIMDVQSEFNVDLDNNHQMALTVRKNVDTGNDIYYVLTVSFQSIQDSIRIFNSFTIIVGFIFMVLAFFIMYFISYTFTNPIVEINKIAQEIANLNFDNKLDIKTDDEYQDLGNSINLMSSQLELNIDELRKSNRRLAEEILYKTDIDKMRREFIANASHELKTPLALIMGYAEALKLEGNDSETKEEYLNIILDETERMNSLVKELLKLSQLESGDTAIEYKDINLRDFIDDTVNSFNIIFEEKGIICNVETDDLVINSDYDQLQKVLTNFINNAINHIDGDKIIKISAKRFEDYSIKVSVYNTGNNIPEEDLNNIWDSFYKVDKARTRAYGGQGLGLSICKTTLISLGYNYGVVNHPNGVEFYFEIFNNEKG